MDRRFAIVIALAAAACLPGCASRNGRVAGYGVGTFATFAGVALTANVMNHPTPCNDSLERMQRDPVCLGPALNDAGRVIPPLLMATTGLSILAATAIASWLHRNDPADRDDEPRHRGRYNRENLRGKIRADRAARRSGP